MKAQKKLNIVLIVLIIILVSITSFGGIYYLEKNQMINIVPDYKLGTNISGYRKITLEVIEDSDQTSTETVTLGEENENTENQVEENVIEETNTEEEKKEKSKNYIKSAEIFKSRLKSLKVEQYNISLDESTGKIELTLPENDQTDSILSDLVNKGNFEICDTYTGEVLLTNKDVTSVKVDTYESYGYIVPYMDINFNISGSKKLKDISAEYNENAVVEVNEVANETSVENVVDTQNDETETDGEESSSTSEVAKTIDLKIDNTTMLTTGFSKIIDSGVLQLTMGATTDESELQESLYGSYNVAAIIENDPLPVDYEVTENLYVQAAIQSNDMIIIICALIAIALIISIFMIVKFKSKGFLMSILSVGYVAILLLVIRYANVILSLDGILAIALTYIMNSGFNYMLLKNIQDKDIRKEEKIDRYKKCMKKYLLILLPLIILTIVCCFINWDAIYSFGMVMFWGILISILYNITVTNIVIRNK